MKKILLTLILGMFLFSLAPMVNAQDEIGPFKIDTDFNITNFCQSADCSYMILKSVKYANGTNLFLNVSMNKIDQEFYKSFSSSDVGKHYFITCGDPSSSELCERDFFQMTLDGRVGSYPYLIAMIVLILTFIGLGYLFYKDKEKMDDKKYWNSMVTKWKDKNYLRFSAIVLWYNIKKNSFLSFYLIGLIIVILIHDIILAYSLATIEPVFSIFVSLYTWGSAIVTLVFFGTVQEWLMEWKKEIEDINWGMSNVK